MITPQANAKVFNAKDWYKDKHLEPIFEDQEYPINPEKPPPWA